MRKTTQTIILTSLLVMIIFGTIGSPILSQNNPSNNFINNNNDTFHDIKNQHLADSPWPMFNQNQDHTSVSPYSTKGVDGTVEWRFGTNSYVYSSPAIGEDGTIYVGSQDTNLYAVNPNGTKKWNFTTNGHVYSSPSVGSDGMVYVGSKDHRLYAIYPNGSQKWNISTGDEISYSSPSIGVDGTIYIGSVNTTKQNFFAINPNGTKKWGLKTQGPVISSPAVDENGTIYIGSGQKMYAINPGGSIKWSYQTGDLIIASPVIGPKGRLYVGSLDGNIYALNKEGDWIWNYKFSGDIAGEILSTPAITDDGTIYVGTDQGSTGGYLVALSQEGGTRSVKWSLHREGLDMFPSPSVSADGTIYMGGSGCGCVDTDYEFFAVTPEGDIKWEERTTTSSSPAIGWDGTVYVGGFSDLYAFESKMEILMESDLNKTSCLPENSLNMNGTASLSNGIIPDGSDVTLEVNNTELHTTVNNEGIYEISFNAPSQPGSYAVKVTINSTEYGLVNSTIHDLTVTEVPEPDIAITSINLNYTVQTLYQGDDIKVEYVVKNLGSAFAEFNISLSLDSLQNVMQSCKMNLSSGEKKESMFITSAFSGEHTLWINAYDVSGDDNRDNNLINASYTAIEKKPSLEMSEISVDRPETMWEGDIVTLEVKIWNNGTSSVNISLVFSIDSESNYSKWFDVHIGIRDKKSIEVDWAAISGQHTLWIIADPNDTIDDGKIDNQTRSVSVSVLKKTSEISISNLKISPDENLTIGDEITASALVENKGTVSAYFDVVLSIDDKDNVSERVIISLGANESETVDFSYTLSTSSHVLWLIADHNESVEENLESDNNVYRIIEASQIDNTEDQKNQGDGTQSDQNEPQTEDDQSLNEKDGSEFPIWILIIISAAFLSIVIFFYWQREDGEEDSTPEE